MTLAHEVAGKHGAWVSSTQDTYSYILSPCTTSAAAQMNALFAHQQHVLVWSRLCGLSSRCMKQSIWPGQINCTTFDKTVQPYKSLHIHPSCMESCNQHISHYSTTTKACMQSPTSTKLLATAQMAAPAVLKRRWCSCVKRCCSSAT